MTDMNNKEFVEKIKENHKMSKEYIKGFHAGKRVGIKLLTQNVIERVMNELNDLPELNRVTELCKRFYARDVVKEESQKLLKEKTNEQEM